MFSRTTSSEGFLALEDLDFSVKDIQIVVASSLVNIGGVWADVSELPVRRLVTI
jgi:hypothetical protein